MGANQIVWKLCSPKGCDPGWWDAECGGHYALWSIARQCRVRAVGHRIQQYDCGWYVFNDETAQMIGPFDTPAAAKEACPIAATVKTLKERS